MQISGKPRLQNVSPLLTITLPDKTIRLALATDSPKNRLVWIHDAQEIEKIPDQPNMAFSQKNTAKDIIYILTIENILKEQFGVYTVKALNPRNCGNSIEFLIRGQGKNIRRSKSHDEMTLIPLTRKLIAQFKAVMDMMQSGNFFNLKKSSLFLFQCQFSILIIISK